MLESVGASMEAFEVLFTDSSTSASSVSGLQSRSLDSSKSWVEEAEAAESVAS